MEIRTNSILIVEDDVTVSFLLSHILNSEGYRTTIAETAGKAINSFEHEEFDLILLDLTLPDADGLQLAKHIKEHTASKIVVLTGRLAHDDRIAALNIGVNDYLTKPVDPKELLLRVRNLLGHCEKDISFRKFQLSLSSRSLINQAGEIIHLTRSEFDLLWVLAANQNKVLSRPDLLESLGKSPTASPDRAIDILVARLRKKIGDDDHKHSMIKTVAGVGYMLEVERSSSTQHAELII